MIYTEKQQKLMDAIESMEAASMKHWQAVVDAVNDLAQGIQEGEDYYDAGFPPELERRFGDGALRTAWIYDRLEKAAGGKRRLSTRIKIRRALGYHTH